MTVRGLTLQHSYIFTVFLDMSAAFDNISWSRLYGELIESPIIPNQIKQMIIYLQTSIRIRVNWLGFGIFFIVSNGCKQGGKLSAKLFAAATNKLSDMLLNSGVGLFLRGTLVNSLLYADDIMLMAFSISALLCLIRICFDWASIPDFNNDLSFGPDKSTCMCLSRSTKLRIKLNLHYNNVPIKQVSTFKYLGTIIQ